MTKKIGILLGSLIVIILIAFAGAAYYVDKNIDPPKIKALIIENIESNLKGTKASIGELEYSIGQKVYFRLSDLNIKRKKTDKYLSKLKDIEVKIPIWSILMGGGTIDFKIKKPLLNVISDKSGKTNWEIVLGSEKKEKQKNEAKGNNSKANKISLPSFVTNSKLNVKIDDVELNQINNAGVKNTIVLEKVYFKDINFVKTTAYEVLSKINLAEGENKISGDAKLVGEFSLKDLLAGEGITLSSRFELTDLKMSSFEDEINLSSKIKLKIDKFGKLFFDTKTKVNKMANLVVSGSLLKDKLSVKNIDGRILIPGVLEFIDMDDSFNMSSKNLLIKGQVEFNTKTSKLNPNIKISTDEDISLSLDRVGNISLAFLAQYIGKTFDLKLSGKSFGGEFEGKVHGKLDPLNLPSDLSKMETIYVLAAAKGLKIPKTIIPEAQEKKELVKDGEQEKKEGTNDFPSLPKVKLTLDINNSNFETIPFKLGGVIETNKNKITSKGVKFFLDKGLTKTAFTTRLKKKTIQVDFNQSIENINLKSLKPLVKDKIKNISGLLNGKTSGELNLSKELKYGVNANIIAKNGEIDGMNIKKILGDLLGKLKKVVPSKKSSFSDRFDSLKADMFLTHKNIKVNELNLVGNKRSLDLKLKGLVSMGDERSNLKGTLFVKNLEKDLKKKTGSSIIPLYLKGKGFVMKPDIKYTSNKLIKTASKNEIKKAKSKLKKSLKDKAKKFLKGFKL